MAFVAFLRAPDTRTTLKTRVGAHDSRADILLCCQDRRTIPRSDLAI